MKTPERHNEIVDYLMRVHKLDSEQDVSLRHDDLYDMYYYMYLGPARKGDRRISAYAGTYDQILKAVEASKKRGRAPNE